MQRWTRRALVAIAGALALHALGLLALVLLARALPARPQRVLQVSLLHAPHKEPSTGTVRAPGPPPAAAPAAPGAPRPARAPGLSPANPHASEVPDSRAKVGARGGPAAPTEQGATSGVRGAPGRSSREWLIAEGLDRAGGGVNTSLDHPESALPSGSGPTDEERGLVRERTREEKLAEEKATVGRKVEGWVTDIKARDRAQTGRDHYWQTLEDALAHGFNPGWDVLDQGPKDTPESRTHTFLQSWQKQAEAYGKSGNPFAGVDGAPGERKPLHEEFIGLGNEDRGLGSVSLGIGLQPLLSLGMVVAGAAVAGKTWNHSLIATVRITQREDGGLVAVELLGTSGNALYDRLVLQRARSLGTLSLGPPKQGRETLWAFETNFTQIPPVPIAGCALDDFIPKNCWYPLQKTARSHVRLQAIY